MTALSLGLVLISALAHSTWNFLLKRSGDKQVFMWLLLVSASVLLVPVGAVLFWLHPFGHPGWAFILATIALHMLYFVFLGRGYTQGDLSLVYPIARGISPMLVPILAVVVLSESIAGPAIIESSFTTVVVDPGASATRSKSGSLIINPVSGGLENGE